MRIRLINSCRKVHNFRHENGKPNKKDISEMTSAGDNIYYYVFSTIVTNYVIYVT